MRALFVVAALALTGCTDGAQNRAAITHICPNGARIQRDPVTGRRWLSPASGVWMAEIDAHATYADLCIGAPQ